MNSMIGDAAGVLWRYLAEHGETATTVALKSTETGTVIGQRAIGWLARENKIEIGRLRGRELLRVIE